MSNFSGAPWARPNINQFKTWSEMGRERYETAVREGKVSNLTSSRCAVCTRQVTEKVLAFSRKHFGRTLCFRCQEMERVLTS